jgi:2-keto-4-pentenoate hydratase/2-oxohepta-3-ene-1,7-dioic acid hydratase in catechol pathway
MSNVLKMYHDVSAFTLDLDASTRAASASALGNGQVTLFPPLDDDAQILCVGKNYLEHVGEVDSSMPGIARAEVPEAPIIFTKSTRSSTSVRGCQRRDSACVTKVASAVVLGKIL